MKIIGLTGSIGMGKSLAAKMFRRHGASVFDADKEVHNMFAEKGAVFNQIAEIFPKAIENGNINRKKLGNIVFFDANKVDILEKIIHPILETRIRLFLKKSMQLKRGIAILDIPLLFEANFDELCDYTITVTTNRTIQKQRVVGRHHISPELFKAIISMQMPSHSKELASDFVIRTGLSKREVFDQVKSIINHINR